LAVLSNEPIPSTSFAAAASKSGVAIGYDITASDQVVQQKTKAISIALPSRKFPGYRETRFQLIGAVSASRSPVCATMCR
jgi:hypothetical protein